MGKFSFCDTRHREVWIPHSLSYWNMFMGADPDRGSFSYPTFWKGSGSAGGYLGLTFKNTQQICTLLILHIFLHCIHLRYCRISAFLHILKSYHNAIYYCVDWNKQGIPVPCICAYFKLNHTYQFNPHFSQTILKTSFLKHNSSKVRMSTEATNAIACYYLHTFHGTNKLTDLLCPNTSVQPASTNAVTQKKQVCPPFFSSLGWEVLFYIPGLIPPMWMRLSRNELCYHWDPSLGWGR